MSEKDPQKANGNLELARMWRMEIENRLIEVEARLRRLESERELRAAVQDQVDVPQVRADP